MEALALSKPIYAVYAALILLAFMQFVAVYYTVNNIVLAFCVLLCLGYSLVNPQTRIVNKANFAPFMYLLFWLAYALLSYNWAIDQKSALEYALIIFINLATFMVFSGLFRNKAMLRLSPWFFFIIFCLYLGIAVWEITSFQHLPVSRYFGEKTFVPTGPFTNENNLAAFFFIPLPFVLFITRIHRSALLKLICGLLALGMFVVITIAGARIAMLAAGLFLFISYFVLAARSTKLFGALIAILLVFAAFQVAGPLMRLGYRMVKRELLSISTEKESARMSSLRIREQLFAETLDIAAGSWFMGVGGGNFETYMNSDRAHRTAGITNAHNYALELLGNFGLLVPCAFAYLYFRWLFALYHRYRNGKGKQKSLYLMYLTSLILFIPLSVLPSSIKWNHLLWVYFAAVNAMSNLDGEADPLYPATPKYQEACA